MHPVEITLLALGLAMDAFAVSVASGIAYRNLRIHHALRMATAFGVFQAIMPVVGWLAGLAARRWVSEFDHWIAFALLALIGGKMIYEAFQIEDAEEPSNPFGFLVLTVLAVATSIDALAVGVTFAMLKTAIVTPVLIIGGVTFVLCLGGVYIGEAFGHFFEKKIEIFGGAVLIAMGLKILVQHLMGLG